LGIAGTVSRVDGSAAASTDDRARAGRRLDRGADPAIVKSRRKAIMLKLGARNMTQAVLPTGYPGAMCGDRDRAARSERHVGELRLRAAENAHATRSGIASYAATRPPMRVVTGCLPRRDHRRWC
jgi:hypothetical protein